jgi:hypothetical protein
LEKGNIAMSELIAFHGNPAVKSAYLDRARKHREADQIRQSSGYWTAGLDGIFRGCAVGCTLHHDDHEAYETELGVPRALAYLEDGLFERMTAEGAKSWPVEFLHSVPVGADLSVVSRQLILWLLIDPEDGILANTLSDDVRSLVIEFSAYLQLSLDGDDPGVAAWNELHAKCSVSDHARSALQSKGDLYAFRDLCTLSVLRDLSDQSDLRSPGDLRSVVAHPDLSPLGDLGSLRALRDCNALSELSPGEAFGASRQFARRVADKLLHYVASAPTA